MRRINEYLEKNIFSSRLSLSVNIDIGADEKKEKPLYILTLWH